MAIDDVAVDQASKLLCGGTSQEMILALLEAKQPLEMADLASQCQIPTDEARSTIESLIQRGQITSVGEKERRLLLTASGWGRLAQRVTSALEDYHRRFPARPGMPKLELAGQMKLGSHAPSALEALAGQGAIIEESGQVRLPSFTLRLTPAQQAKIDTFLQSLARNPYSPPGDLIPEPDLLSLLVDRRQVVRVSGGVVFSAAAYDDMVARITALMADRGRVTLGEVRDLFGTSRKYAQAFLEYLDEKKITRRVGDERILYHKS